jgi:glycerol-3-phosphate O-acyltransferase
VENFEECYLNPNRGALHSTVKEIVKSSSSSFDETQVKAIEHVDKNLKAFSSSVVRKVNDLLSRGIDDYQSLASKKPPAETHHDFDDLDQLFVQ